MKLLGNLLLIVGTVLAGLAAANSERASRLLPLDRVPATEEFLFNDVADPMSKDTVLVPRGTALTGVVIAGLRKAGLESVLVRVPPRASEVLPTAECAGRVLAKPVVAGKDKAGKPLVHKAGKFVDTRLLAILQEAGVASAEVKISRRFAFADWDMKWVFLLGVLAMIAGVILIRSQMGGAKSIDGSGELVTTATVHGWLQQLTQEVERMAARVQTMEVDAIHTSLTPMFAEYGQPFVDHRELLRKEFGGAKFARILGPFASAERRLNRAWSAAVDQYVDEARAQVQAALPYLHESLAAFPS